MAQSHLAEVDQSFASACYRGNRNIHSVGIGGKSMTSYDSNHLPKHVLDGYKVLDFTQVVAGPTAP